MGEPSFTTTVTAARALPSRGVARKKFSKLLITQLRHSVISIAAPVIARIWSGCRGVYASKRHRDAWRLRQRDCLERADHVVGALFGEEAFIIAGAEIPVRPFVIVVAIKAPDTAHYDETTDPVVPVIADVIKTQVGARESALETRMIIEDQLRQANDFCHERHLYFPGCGSMIAQRTEFPLHINDTAVIRRQFSFGYLSHKRKQQFS